MIKLTEDDKDTLRMISDTAYYTPLIKAINQMVDVHANKVLTKTEKEALWEARLELEGAKRLQRDIVTLFRELRREIKEEI